MNYWKKLVIPAIILAALAIGLVIAGQLSNGNTSVTTTSGSGVEFLYYAAENEVDTLTLKNETGTLVLDRSSKKADDGTESIIWVMRTPANPAFVPDALRSLSTGLRTISTVRLIAESVTDLKPYGLDKPLATLTAKESDGDTVEVLLGSLAGSGSNYYAMVSGTGKVYTIPTSFGQSMLSPAMSYLDKVLCSVPYMDIKSFDMNRSTDNASVKMTSSVFYDKDKNPVELQWMFTEPVNRPAVTMGVQPVIEQVLAARATAFITMEAKAADLATYGLDKPSYVFEISDANQAYTITLGKSAGSGLVYGMSSRIPNAVYTVATSAFNLVDAPITQWVDPFIFLGDITQVTRVKLAFDDKMLDIEIDGKTEPNVFKINGKDANIVNSSDKNYFKSFYQAIIGTTLAGIDPGADPDLSKASVTIEYAFREGPPKKVAYSPRDQYTLYAYVDGVYTGCYVDIKMLDNTDFGVGNILPLGLRTAYAGMVNAMDKAVDGVYN